MPLDDKAITSVADSLIAARRSGVRIPAPALDPPSDDEVYRIQDRVAAAIGPVGAWKTGPAPAGEQPSCAPIFASTLRNALADPVIRVGKPVGVELEIAFRFVRGFAAASQGPAEADILAAIGTAHIAIELCDTRFENREATPLAWRKADNTVNEGLVLGMALREPFSIDLPALHATLSVDGVVTVDATGALPTANLAPTLVWLVRHCVTRRGGFVAGTIVTTGSWTGMQFHPPGARIRGEFAGVGGIEIQLA